MSSVFVGLLREVSEASEKLADAEYFRDAFLKPILEILGAKGGVTHCSVERGLVDIELSGSYRGSEWRHNYEFPEAIFTCENPLAAAAEYVAAKKKAEEDAKVGDTLLRIQRLQEELAKLQEAQHE